MYHSFLYLYLCLLFFSLKRYEHSYRKCISKGNSDSDRKNSDRSFYGDSDLRKRRLKMKKKTNNTWISWNVRWDKMKSDYMMTNSTCNAECKISELSKKGIRDEIARSLVINCKDLAKDPVMCIKIWASIVKNESWGWYVCKKYNKYNCMWLGVKDQYKSYNDWVLHWVGKYNKRWYKAKNMSFFYSPAWKLPPSSYCTSEDSSNTAIGCPNWLRISSSFFNSLSF